MTEPLAKILQKLAAIPKDPSPNTSTATEPAPVCPHCGGAGYLRYDVPIGHEKFGKLEPCVCQTQRIIQQKRARLFELSNLDHLSHLTFQNFNLTGNPQRETYTPQELQSLETAQTAALMFAQQRTGWLLLQGAYGCGKTHLAAAIANHAVEQGVPTLFITVPDLLDFLRFAYDDPQTTFEMRFDEVRNVHLLILDDFGTQNATAWAQEKLFQIINYRYINKLPTVITTNLILDEIEPRIRSRLQDQQFVKQIVISAPDYRRPTQSSNPGLSMLPLLRDKTFSSFLVRDDELNSSVTTTVTVERQDRYKNIKKETEVITTKITQANLDTLSYAVRTCFDYAENPHGWLLLLGGTGCGKTHLAAAIGNHRLESGGQVIMVDVADLLDYLKSTFRPSVEVSFDRRFYEIKTTPLLILDNLVESGISSAWAETKLNQILLHRHNARLPTILTSPLNPQGFATAYPVIWHKILSAPDYKIISIDMPPYHFKPPTQPKPTTSRRKSNPKQS